MVTRETYYCSCREKFEAEDALLTINPYEIREAVDSFIKTLESVSNELSSDIEKVSPEVEESIRSEGKSYAPSLLELNDNIKEKLNTLSDTITAENYPSKAETMFNNLQTTFNADAKQKAIAHEDTHKKEN